MFRRNARTKSKRDYSASIDADRRTQGKCGSVSALAKLDVKQAGHGSVHYSFRNKNKVTKAGLVE